MNVSLTPELKQFVEKEVPTGMYQTTSEVIRAGLRRLKDDQRVALRTPTNITELEADLLRAVDSIEAGRGVKASDALARLRKRAKASRQHA